MEVLDLVFELVCEQMGNNRSFTKMQEFFICLIKLRMNYLFKDMAFQLNVSVQTVQKTSHDTLEVLFSRLLFLVHWPERNELQNSMPQCFLDAFGKKVSVIVDCFELFVKHPVVCAMIL